MPQWRPASSSARAHGQAALFQLLSIISDACRATELMKRVRGPKPMAEALRGATPVCGSQFLAFARLSTSLWTGLRYRRV